MMTDATRWTEMVKPGLRYREQEGILVSEKAPEILGRNQKYQRFYDKIAGLYDLWEILYAGLLHGGRDSARHDLLEKLVVKPGDKVLEVSIGTGVNLKYLPAEAEYFGLDVSWKMLQRCRRNLPKWNRQATLFHGIAEDLPFRDGVFDVVYHIGGVNFFGDPRQAIQEMIRVARRGALILYGDETEKMVREIYARTPLAGRQFQGEHVPSPLTWLPANVNPNFDVILKGNFYIVSFAKP
jgi:ubiquinone/menaquinone biosynthesis C-methylase UbiE